MSEVNSQTNPNHQSRHFENSENINTHMKLMENGSEMNELKFGQETKIANQAENMYEHRRNHYKNSKS